MIVDTLENADRYLSLHPLFARAFDYLRKQNTLEPGTFEIAGRDLYVIISESDGEAPKQPKLEAHRRYIDIQIALDGRFDIGWKPLASCSNLCKPYDSENDYLLFDDTPESWLTLKMGGFGIFFPQDAHAPKGSLDPLKKAVFKVAMNPG